MKGKVIRRRSAQRDLVVIYRHYAREAGRRIADRFLTTAEAAFRRLADMPGLGKRYEHEHPALAELRVSVVSAPFNVYLVFYRPIAGGVEIVRVLHGARDTSSILAEEFGIEEDAGGVLMEE
jgi:toxin ParE1/3/4